MSESRLFSRLQLADQDLQLAVSFSILCAVSNLKTSIVVAAAMLATTHAFGTLPTSKTTTPLAAEVKEQQETVNLTISGMT